MRLFWITTLLIGCSNEPTAAKNPNGEPTPSAEKKAAPEKAATELGLLKGKQPTFTLCEGEPITIADKLYSIYESDLNKDSLLAYSRLDKEKKHVISKFTLDLSGDKCKIEKAKKFKELTSSRIISGFELFDMLLPLADAKDSAVYMKSGTKKGACKELWGVSRLERVPGKSNTAIGMHKNKIKQYTFTPAGCTVSVLYDKPEDGMPGYYYGVREDGGVTGNFSPKGEKSQIIAFARDGKKNWVYKAKELKRNITDLEVVGDTTVLLDKSSKREIVLLDNTGKEVAKAPFKEALAALGQFPDVRQIHHSSGNTFIMLVDSKQEDGKFYTQAVRVDL